MKKRHFFILLLAVLLLTNSIVAFADNLIFTDIKDHWAKEFIEDIYNRKITQGYTDATFRPGNSITNLETSVMLGNMLKATANNSLLVKYENIVRQYNIPAWAQNQVVYLLDKGVLLESEIKTFVTNGLGNNAKRHEVATYIGRVLVEFGGKSTSRSYYIPYKDELSIPNDAKPYIDLLLSLDILNKESNDGQFLPNNNITRAETAKLMALTAKILDNGLSTTAPDSVEEAVYVNGVINNIVVANRTVLTIFDEDSNTAIYDVKDNAKVTIDGSGGSLQSLEKGQAVKFKLLNGVVEEIEAISNKEAVEGYFQRVFANEGENILTVKTLNGEFKYYTVAPNTKVYLNDEISSFSNYKVGDFIKAYINGIYVYEVEAGSKNKMIKGVVTSKGTTTDRKLEVTPKDEEPIAFTLETNTVIKRDGRTVTLNDIKLHDEVTLELEYDKVKTVTAASVKRTFEGTIKRIVNAEETVITVENKSQETEEFVISSTAIILIDSTASTVYDLRLNYSVIMHIENNEVYTIITSKKVEPESYIGKVKSINREINVMTVTIEQNGTTKDIQVHVKNTTTFIGKTGSAWHFSLINVGDQLLLVGTMTNGAFVLDRVVVVN